MEISSPGRRRRKGRVISVQHLHLSNGNLCSRQREKKGRLDCFILQQGKWGRGNIRIKKVSGRCRSSRDSHSQHLPSLRMGLSSQTAPSSLSSTFYPFLTEFSTFSGFLARRISGTTPLCLIHLDSWENKGCRIPEPFQAVCPSLDISEAAPGLETESKVILPSDKSKRQFPSKNKRLGFN